MPKNNLKIYHNQKGAILLLTTLILMSTMLIIALTVNLGGIVDMISGFDQSQSDKALQLADTCAEEGYFRLKKDNNYIGSTINFTEGNCTINVSGNGNLRTIISTGNFRTFTRSITSQVILINNNAGNAEGVLLDEWSE